jgi:hypothetical protein
VTYEVRDKAGLVSSCTFGVKVSCGMQWARKTSFEEPALSSCASTQGSTFDKADMQSHKELAPTTAPPATCSLQTLPVVDGSRDLCTASGGLTQCGQPIAGSTDLGNEMSELKKLARALSIHDTLIDNAAKNGNTQDVKNLIEEARASQLSFKSSWKSQPVADNEDNLGTYKGLTEDYDCDDIGLVRGGTLAYTSPECTRLSPAERYKSICTGPGGAAVDLADDFAKAKGAQSLAALCAAKDNTFNPIGPLTASGEVCGAAEIAAGACTATARAVESLAVCALAVRRYQTTQPGGWAADIGAVHYASGDICTDSPSTTAISCKGTCSGTPAACATKNGDQVGCQAIAECTYTKPYRVAATRHCYAVPSDIDIAADKYPSDKGPDTPIPPVADETTLDVLGAGLYWLPSNCLDHWHGYPYAKSAGAGAQYYAISDPDGEVALTFGTVYIPRGDQVHQVLAPDEWGARDKKTWMASDGNNNVWVSFKYRVSWKWNTGTWKQLAGDGAHPANGVSLFFYLRLATFPPLQYCSRSPGPVAPL